MYYTISIKGYDRTAQYLRGLEVKLPKALDKDARTVMTDFRRGLRDEILSQDLMWHRILLNSVGYQKTGRNQYMLWIRDYGEWLDSMRMHTVRIDKHPVLQQWAIEHLGVDRGYLTVKPHPWIRAGLERGRKKIRQRLANGHVVRLLKRFVPGGL